MNRRPIASFLLYSGLVLGGAAIVLWTIPAAAQWAAGLLPPSITVDNLAMGLIGVGAVLALSMRFVWKCPHCGAFPGPVSAPRCRSCGKALNEAPGIQPSGTLNPPPPDRTEAVLDPAKASEFQSVMRRLHWIATTRSLKRSVPMALVFGVLAGIGVAIDLRERPDGSQMAGLAAVAGTFIAWIVLYRVLGLVKSGVLVALRCPGCRKSLIGNVVEFCPHCGVRLPLAAG